MPEQFDAYRIATALLSGLALFLFGMRMLGSGLRKASGSRIREMVSAVTGNRMSCVAAGALATVTVQSSSLVVVTLIGLVQSRLITSFQAFAIMIGAEVGTTFIVQLIAFSPGKYGLALFAAGFFMSLAARSMGMKSVCEAVAGLGLVLAGLNFMGDAVEPLRSSAAFSQAVRGLGHPLAGILAGMAMTAILQSSSAFLGIVLAVATQGALTLEAAIALMLGANIGTCITAFLGSIGTMRSARRVFLSQLLFNCSGVAAFMLFIPAYADLLRAITPVLSFAGASQHGAIGRQIANAHTIYNLTLALLYLPVLPGVSAFVERILPDDPEELRRIPALRFIQESALAAPSLALGLARAEAARMNRIVCRMSMALLDPFLDRPASRDVVYADLPAVEGIRIREEKADFLDRKLTDYLIRISRAGVGDSEVREVAALMNIVKELEAVADIVETLLEKMPELTRGLNGGPSDQGRAELEGLHRQVCSEQAALTLAVQDMDPRRASAVLSEERTFSDLHAAAEAAHAERVRIAPESAASHDLHMELLIAFDRIHVSVMHIARTIRRASGPG